MTSFSMLTDMQRFALLDMVFHGALGRVDGGYEGSIIHAPDTVRALSDLALCGVVHDEVFPIGLGRFLVRQECRRQHRPLIRLLISAREGYWARAA